MSTPITLMSVYSEVNQAMSANQNISFEKIGMPATTSNIFQVGGVAIEIREVGVYEVTYGVSSLTGGTFYVMDAQGLRLFQASLLHVLPDSNASITFFCRVFSAMPTMLQVSSFNPISISSTPLINNQHSVSAYLNVKKISS